MQNVVSIIAGGANQPVEPSMNAAMQARDYVIREYPSAYYDQRKCCVIIAETLEVGNGSESFAWREAAERIRTHNIRCDWSTEFRIKSKILAAV